MKNAKKDTTRKFDQFKMAFELEKSLKINIKATIAQVTFLCIGLIFAFFRFKVGSVYKTSENLVNIVFLVLFFLSALFLIIFQYKYSKKKIDKYNIVKDFLDSKIAGGISWKMKKLTLLKSALKINMEGNNRVKYDNAKVTSSIITLIISIFFTADEIKKAIGLSDDSILSSQLVRVLVLVTCLAVIIMFIVNRIKLVFKMDFFYDEAIELVDMYIIEIEPPKK